MFEIEVIVSNRGFIGSTGVYDQAKHFLSFADQLVDFSPLSSPIFYESGKEDDYAYFSIKVYPVGLNGLIGVQVNIEENTAGSDRLEGKPKLRLEVLAEPSSMDDFQKFVRTIAETQSGRAVLYGQT